MKRCGEYFEMVSFDSARDNENVDVDSNLKHPSDDATTDYDKGDFMRFSLR